jgi:hypothetical protein
MVMAEISTGGYMEIFSATSDLRKVRAYFKEPFPSPEIIVYTMTS